MGQPRKSSASLSSRLVDPGIYTSVQIRVKGAKTSSFNRGLSALHGKKNMQIEIHTDGTFGKHNVLQTSHALGRWVGQTFLSSSSTEHTSKYFIRKKLDKPGFEFTLYSLVSDSCWEKLLILSKCLLPYLLTLMQCNFYKA